MGNNYSSAIDEIMPLVRDGDKSRPFFITRDSAYGDWLVCYPQPTDKAGHAPPEQITGDPFAVMSTGADFAGGSYPYVYDKVLSDRLRAEYCYTADISGEDKEKLLALMNFFEDNIGEFSSEVTEYLTTLDRPLASLSEMYLFDLATSHDGSTYNEDLTSDAIDRIEHAVENRLRGDGEIAPQKRVINGYEEKLNVRLAGQLVIFAENAKSDDPYLVCNAKWDNPLGVTEYLDGAVFGDYLEAMREFIDRVDTLLIGLEKECAAFPTVQPTLTAADCIPGGLDESLVGYVVVIKPEALAPEYRTANHQLKIVLGGFGASPDSRGNAVFCRDLYSDKETRFERYDIAGVIAPDRLPDWAKAKLAFLEALKEPGVFEFGGYHFKPYRAFEKRDGDFFNQAKNMASDRAPGIAAYDWGKTEYTHAKFYEAANSKDDIFRCLENGGLYVPCENELSRYSEPTKKIKVTEKPAKKPSLLGELEDAKAIVAARNTAHGDKPAPNKKRGDTEVN